MITVESLIEVKIAEEEDFLKIKETLTRIGVASRKDKKLLSFLLHGTHQSDNGFSSTRYTC